MGRTGTFLDWPVTDLLLVIGISRAVDEFDRTKNATRVT